MAISRKTFNTVKDILKELDQRRSDSRSASGPAGGENGRAMPKNAHRSTDHPGDGPSGRPGLSDQLIG